MPSLAILTSGSRCLALGGRPGSKPEWRGLPGSAGAKECGEPCAGASAMPWRAWRSPRGRAGRLVGLFEFLTEIAYCRDFLRTCAMLAQASRDASVPSRKAVKAPLSSKRELGSCSRLGVYPSLLRTLTESG
jgi:hypothetical protein